ncbi:MAG: MFS transporter [Lachnospira sp.]|nr:MFS transporter [Lachnospira sp.]
MQYSKETNYMKNFLPYAIAAFLIGIVGGLSTVLGPAFMQDMNLDYNNTTWTALAQAISTAACAPILGKLSDIYGRRNTLLFGIIIYTSGSILSALSTSLPFLLVARFVVGIGSAAVTPTVISYIITEFPPQMIAKGFSLYMLISSAAVIFGPTLGGLIIELSGWRALMWISSIICGIFFFLCLFTLPKESYKKKTLKDFDRTGAFFVIAFFSLLLCVPSFGQNFGWTSIQFIIALFLALVTLVLLVYAEKNAKNPILIGSFMSRKAFILPVIILFLTQGLMQANMTNTIVFVNYTQPTNTAISGYAISIMYIGMSLGAILIGPLADRYEPKFVLTGSLLLTAVGCATMLTFTEGTAFLLLASSLGILGFGLGANATIFMKIVLSNLPESSAGAGTGIYGLFRDISAPFGVAVFVPMFTNEITRLSTNTSYNMTAATAAVNSIHLLAIIELVCVGLGILIVQLLPIIRKK